jgi:hypothetical protein
VAIVATELATNGNRTGHAQMTFATCIADCGQTGNSVCESLETPKNTIPPDCSISCGDGSCDESEMLTCSQDCGCEASPDFMDIPGFCGDGYCNPYSIEDCENCPQDCIPLDADGDDVPHCRDCNDNDPDISLYGRPVRIPSVRTAYYDILQVAYDSAIDGQTIQVKSEVLFDGFIMNLNKNITLETGYDCEFSSAVADTIVRGSLLINNGKLLISMGKLILE